QRGEQARSRESLEHGVSTGESAEAPIAETVVAALEDAERVAGLGGFELRQRPEFRKPAFVFRLVGRGRRSCGELLRLAVARVTLAEDGTLEWKAAVVVQRRAPQKRTVRHKAGAELGHDLAVATLRAAGL